MCQGLNYQAGIGTCSSIWHWFLWHSAIYERRVICTALCKLEFYIVDKFLDDSSIMSM